MKMENVKSTIEGKQKRGRKQQKSEEARKNEKAKKLKGAFKTINQNSQRGECLKLITVKIDDQIYNDNLGIELLKSLEESSIKCVKHSQIIPNTITWNREIQFVDDDDVNEPKISTVSLDENELVLIMQWNKIVELVSNKSLISHITEQKTLIPDKRITLVLYGLQNYFRHLKNLQNQKMKQNIAGNSSGHARKKSIYDNVPNISFKDLEYQLTELQIVANVNHKNVETQADFNYFIFHCSKSIAEAPLKLEKRLHDEINCFIKGSNKDTVRVDKDGNGLQRVWQQQLMQFSLASLEIVQAITTKYPMPSALLQEYEKVSEEEGELLLQNLLIRRTAGPTAHQRKVGPEMSKKIYNFFTTVDGNSVITHNE